MTTASDGSPQRSRRGRPAYRPGHEARRIVEELKFCGDSDNVIARSLGIDPDTLRKHFKAELAQGHAHRRKEIVGLLFRAARKGNVSAIKHLEELGRAAGAAEALNGRSAAAPRPEKLGKKQLQQLAAQRVGGKFAPPEPPKLIVSND